MKGGLHKSSGIFATRGSVRFVPPPQRLMCISQVKCIKCNVFKSQTGTCNYDKDSYICNLKKMKRRVIYAFLLWHSMSEMLHHTFVTKMCLCYHKIFKTAAEM